MTASALTARAATVADEPEITRLLHMMHEEGGLFPLHLDRAKQTFAQAFDRKGGVIGVIGPPNDIEAMIGLMISQLWYTHDYNLSESNFLRELLAAMRALEWPRVLVLVHEASSVSTGAAA
jgi:N-acetylglutamate synthase-like GNAT family acetyltransferase